MEEKLAQLHEANTKLVLFSIIGWMASIGILFGVGMEPQGADSYYKPVVLVLALSLSLFGLLHLWFGLVRDLGFDSILRTSVALLFGFVALSVVYKDEKVVTYFSIGLPIYLVVLAAIYYKMFGKAADNNKQCRKEEDNDCSIRGTVSIFQTGSESYKYVLRHNLNNKSKASKFEGRLVRYIERKLDKIPHSLSGNNCDYWRIATDINKVDLMVIGNGFNTSLKLNGKNDWLLRIRETEPFHFTQWIAKHFSEGSGVTRRIGKNQLQTQFSSSMMLDDKKFFKQDIDPIDLDVIPSFGITPEHIVKSNEDKSEVDSPDEIIH